MELYEKVSYIASRQFTLAYSSSFGISSKLFSTDIRKHIYAVYGLVRIADEIVDTYKGIDAQKQLDDLEQQTYAAIEFGYSSNPIVHAFALTSRRYGISTEIVAPFFFSMRMDLTPQSYTPEKYAEYIHGSAEVVGLMCLKVFCTNDQPLYESLRPGACALGSAYQKVNFLRDIASDYRELGRLYFPDVNYETLDDMAKSAIVADIQKDFDEALPALNRLPSSSRAAVMTSYAYYTDLLRKIDGVSVQTLKSERIRISTPHKLWTLATTATRVRLNI